MSLEKHRGRLGSHIKSGGSVGKAQSKGRRNLFCQRILKEQKVLCFLALKKANFEVGHNCFLNTGMVVVVNKQEGQRKEFKLKISVSTERKCISKPHQSVTRFHGSELPLRKGWKAEKTTKKCEFL